MNKKTRKQRLCAGGGWLFEDSHDSHYNKVRGYVLDVANIGHMVAAGLAMADKLKGNKGMGQFGNMDFMKLANLNTDAKNNAAFLRDANMQMPGPIDEDLYGINRGAAGYACGGHLHAGGGYAAAMLAMSQYAPMVGQANLLIQSINSYDYDAPKVYGKNFFAGGGGLGTASGIVEGVSLGLELYAKDARIDDNAVNAAKVPLKGMLNNKVTSNSMDSLMADWSNAARAKTDWNRYDFLGEGTLSRALKGLIGASLTGILKFMETGNKWAGIATTASMGIGNIFGTISAKRKARKEARTANRIGSALNEILQGNYMARANMLDTDLDMMNQRSYAANGGRINVPVYNPYGAISYLLANDALYNEYLNSTEEQRLPSMPNSFLKTNVSPIYAEGGGLSREKNYGSSKKPYPSVKSSDFAGGNRSYPIPTKADALRLAGLHGRSDVKAKVYAKYPSLKHAFGGNLSTNGADWTNGLTWFNNGGTHEENPNNGIPLGIAPDGLPNLVEEGEVKYNDYIFSNRLKVTKDMQEKYKLNEDTTYAEAIKKLSKESEERPNDPISLNGLDVILNDLTLSQEEVRMKKLMGQSQQLPVIAACGGHLHKYDGITPTPYGSYLYRGYHPHIESFNTILDASGAPMYLGAVAPEGNSTKEELKPSTKKAKTVNLKKEEVSEEPIQRIPLDLTLTRALLGNPVVDNLSKNAPSREQMTASVRTNKARLDRELEANANINALSELMAYNALPTWMRYAPLFDYAEAPDSSAINYLSVAPNYKYAAAPRVGQYQLYRPFDTLYTINQLLSDANAARRAIRNTAGGNRSQALANLALQNALALNVLGLTLLGINKEDLARYNQTLAANNALDLLNAQMALEADRANMSINSLEVLRRALAANLAYLIALDLVSARNATRTHKLLTLGNIGRENMDINRANSNMALGYAFNPYTGESYYKRGARNGGYLTIKKKKGGKK